MFQQATLENYGQAEMPLRETTKLSNINATKKWIHISVQKYPLKIKLIKKVIFSAWHQRLKNLTATPGTSEMKNIRNNIQKYYWEFVKGYKLRPTIFVEPYGFFHQEFNY